MKYEEKPKLSASSISRLLNPSNWSDDKDIYLIKGIEYHEFIQDELLKEFSLSHNVLVEESFTVDYKKFIAIGDVDAVINNVMIEFKTSSSDRKLYDHNLIQILFYLAVNRVPLIHCVKTTKDKMIVRVFNPIFNYTKILVAFEKLTNWTLNHPHFRNENFKYYATVELMNEIESLLQSILNRSRQYPIQLTDELVKFFEKQEYEVKRKYEL